MAIIFGSDAGIQQDSLATFFTGMWEGIQQVGEDLANAFTMNPLDPPALPPKENVHVDNGFKDVPGTAFVGSSVDNVDDIKQRTITSQQPMLTVYLKKRAFWSLKNENTIKYLDSGEKLFLRATKTLFEKKCSQIAAYEALTKLQTLIDEESELDASRAEQMATFLEEALDGTLAVAYDIYNQSMQGVTVDGQFDVDASAELVTLAEENLWNAIQEENKFRNIIDGFRAMASKARGLRNATQTTWVVDNDVPDIFGVGRGSGVIELTCVADISTSLTLESSLGNINFTIEDPYNLMKISNNDIESALSSAKAESEMFESGLSLKGPQYYLDEARRKEEELRRKRRNKIAGNIDYWLGTNLSQDSGNDVLGTTDAPEIVFEVNPSSGAANKVSATLTNSPEVFTKDDFRIIMLRQPLEFQLNPEEDKLVEEIFSLLENYVIEVQNLNSGYRENNLDPDVRHARTQLRKHYLGKSIVQPMDGVHVYIRGNTVKHDELVGPLATLLNNTQFIKSFSNDADVTNNMLEKEMEAFGISEYDIPTDLYRSFRTSGMLRNGGVHVFGGLVSEVSEEYNASSGVYTTTVSGRSNLRWLTLSRVNFAPSLDQTQGLLEDPLTPFDIQTNPGTGLIEKANLNKQNQERKDKGILFFNSGPWAGQPYDDLKAKYDYIDSGDGGVQEQLKHVPGIVYKWKEGIITATRNVNLQTSLDGSEDNVAKLRRDMGISVVPKPFSGQDAADIVSMLVTGFPHNYESFYENAMSVGTFNNSPAANSPQTYFHSFFDILRSQNMTFGNFQPVKVINVDPEVMHRRIKEQGFLTTQSKEINELRRQLSDFLDQRNVLGLSEAYSSADDEETSRLWRSLDTIISDIKKQIDTKTKEFATTADSVESAGMRIYGNDIAFDVAQGADEDEKQTASRLRLRNTLLKFRPQHDCKFNYDSNLFIVGDEYDKDLDIQAFVIDALGSQQTDLWKSSFKDPLETCKTVAKTLDFEFFCDTQGHIQFRPPRYNKVPLSLLLKMFILSDREGKEIYPAFVKSLFKSQHQSYSDELELLDFEIDMEKLLLGEAYLDINRKQGVVVDELLKSDSPPDTLSTEDMADRVNKIIDLKNDISTRVGGKKLDPKSDEDKKDIASEIQALTDPSNPNMYSNRLAHMNRLGKLVSRRQMVYETKQKLDEQGAKYEATTSVGSFTSSHADILGPYEDLIEDDYNDYLGPGSSKRFIIYDHQIIRSNFTESDQNAFCNVGVDGQQDLVGDKPGSLGGVPVLWAGATDFDLWRQYGWRPMDGGVSRPYFRNAETQCAPYAVMLLSRARKNIVRGSLTVYGNEYYQLGDVVYINSRDMLYYVTSVRHNFSYSGGNFTTSLELGYGHPLGEYIPTPLDVIGKKLIQHQTEANAVVTSRETASTPLGVHLGLVKFPPNGTPDEFITMLSGAYAKFNVEELKNSLVKANIYVGDNTKDSYPKVEVRGFLTSPANEDAVKNRIKAVVRWLGAPEGRYIESEGRHIILSSEKFVSKKLEANQISSFRDPVNIGIATGPAEAVRFPKEEVFSAAEDTGAIDHVVEMVLIFKEIKSA